MEDIVKKVKYNLKKTQYFWKIYADLKIIQKEFNVRDHVYLKVKPNKSTLILCGCARLSPRYCGPFKVLARVVPIAYQLALPTNIKIHNVFHVSLLNNYVMTHLM